MLSCGRELLNANQANIRAASGLLNGQHAVSEKEILLAVGVSDVLILFKIHPYSAMEQHQHPWGTGYLLSVLSF